MASPDRRPDDAEQVALVDRIGRGDPAAEERFATIYSERVRVIALARTRDHEAAREIAQDVIVSVIRALRAGQVRSGDRLTGFVLGTLRNLVNNHFRTHAAQPAAEPLEPNHAAYVPADPVEQEERRRLIVDALGQLSGDDRTIVRLTLVEGLKPGEIARRLHLSDEVVRTRKSRAVKRIVEYVQARSRS